jgi:hypothetical protein
MIETDCRHKFVLPCPLRDRCVKVVGGCYFFLSLIQLLLFVSACLAPLCLSSSFRLFLITVFTSTQYFCMKFDASFESFFLLLSENPYKKNSTFAQQHREI